MAADTGFQITRQQAPQSEQSLVPEKLDWNMEPNDIPLAVPGLTEFA